MQDPTWRAQPPAWRARQAWLAVLSGVNQRLSAATLAQEQPPVELQDPLLIAGPWRSGTTVMHELLAAAAKLTTPRTWQCMDPCAFMLPRRDRRNSSIARPMDGLSIDTESPQEDEFALLGLGVESAYRAFWMPHRLEDLHHTLDPAYWLANANWLGPWEDFLRGVLTTTPEAHQPLVLKSPNHTFRAAAIARRFPAARWVWMLREPTAVFHSNRKMWTQMFATHGLTPPRVGALDDFLAHALDRVAAVLQQVLDRQIAGRFAFIAHEHLLEQPAAAVATTLEQLQLPRADVRALDDAIARTGRGRVERYDDAALPPAVAAACARLAAVQRAALDVQYTHCHAA
jgi:hypothetical protein